MFLTKHNMSKIIDDLNWRYATKKFDSNKHINEDDLSVILESLRLVPSSYGLQPLKFILVESKEIRERLVAASYGQTQVADSSHLIVICAAKNTDANSIDEYLLNISNTRDVPLETIKGYGEFMKGTISKMDATDIISWNSKQAYIALGQLLHTCASMRIDATPMEGFDAKSYTKILHLEEEYFPILVCPIGYRHEDDMTQHQKKVRKSHDQLFEKR